MKEYAHKADCVCKRCRQEALAVNREHFWETFGIFEAEMNAFLERYGL